MTRLCLLILPAIWVVAPARAQDAAADRKEGEILRSTQQSAYKAEGFRGVVTGGGKEAVDAGAEVLAQTGNAADAAAATILALTVTDSRLFCFGGEVPILYLDKATGRVEVICGQGAAPQLATREHFLKRWGIPGKGIEAAAVPGALDAVLTLLDRHGTLTFSHAVGPTLRLLERRREPWHADLETTLRRLMSAESLGTSRSDGLKRVSDYFYRGPIAREIDQWSQANGGLLRFSDLAVHVTRIEAPVSITYRGNTVYKCGAWTQGPALLQCLQILENFDYDNTLSDEANRTHLAVEALKLALADRDRYYGDPLFTDVPLAALLDPEYARKRSRLIDPLHASKEIRPGDPISGRPLIERSREIADRLGPGGSSTRGDTTTCLASDAKGNVVAATPSGWSGVLAGKTGVWLGSRLQSFNLWEGHPNCIAPGKRPRITLSPTIVRRSDGSTLAVSVAGGDNQDQVTLQILLADRHGPDAELPVVEDRWLTDHFVGSFLQTKPKLGSLSLMEGFDSESLEKLRKLGHDVSLKRPPMAAAPCILELMLNGAAFLSRAVGDPRAGRHSAAP